MGSFGAVNVLWLNAIAFGVSALGMLLLVPELGVMPANGSTIMEDIREGLGWMWRQRALRTIVFAALIVNFVFSPIAAVTIPYFSKVEFGSATALGLIMSGFGGGGLIGALAYGALGTKIRRRTQFLLSLSLFTLPVLGMATLPSLWMACLLMLFVGIGVGAVNPMVSTMLFTMTPTHMLGRISGVFQAGAMVAAPVGILIGGPLIAIASLQGTFLIFGIILATVLIALVLNGSLHELDAPVTNDGTMT